MPKTKTVLMCAPTYFDIEYEINAWMDKNNQVDSRKAAKQWQNLHDIYTQKLGWDVQLIEPVKGLPDMVFTANGGLVFNGKVVLPRFENPERQPETEYFKKWFQQAGYQDIFMPTHNFEGEGDAFVWHDYLFAGYGYRTDIKAHQEIAEYLGLKPISMKKTSDRFYHLDTALTFINDEVASVYPGAFDKTSLKKLHELVPTVIEATEEDAMHYGLNAMVGYENIILSDHPKDLMQKYQDLGLSVHTADITEFLKSGGGVKCLTLELR